MTHYIKNGNTFRVMDAEAIDLSNKLPAGNYMVQIDQNGIYYLACIASFELPTKLYGDVERNTHRIITTYHDRSASTGILLTGEKGSGKTMLAKNLSNTLLLEGIATVVINECMYGDAFNKFIQSIDQPCVILFDEFEKVYKDEEQEQILTLLDGVFPTKKMFIFTSNESRRINSHMCNRPGRVFYTIRHSGLEDEFIRQYCKDTLKNKTYIDEICKLSVLFDAFNFDMLKALIEEMNRYDESPQDSMRILNAIPEDDDSNEFNVSLVIDGAKMKDNRLQDNGIWWGNPLHPSGFEISYRNPLHDQGDEPYWLQVVIDLATLISMEVDPKTGTFEFTNSLGQYVKLVRAKKMYYNYHAF